jgi:hypothetical protein
VYSLNYHHIDQEEYHNDSANKMSRQGKIINIIEIKVEIPWVANINTYCEFSAGIGTLHDKIMRH